MNELYNYYIRVYYVSNTSLVAVGKKGNIYRTHFSEGYARQIGNALELLTIRRW